MPIRDQASISVPQAVYDALNRARKNRGQTWAAYLEDAAQSLETEREGVRVDEVSPGALEDVAARTARAVKQELEAGAW